MVSNIRPDDENSSAMEQKEDVTSVQFDDDVDVFSSWADTAAWMAPEVTVETKRQNFKSTARMDLK